MAKDECVKPSKGPLDVSVAERKPETAQVQKEAVKMIARVGKAAPDFEASAYIDGGFKNLSLSGYRGKWVVLCFYPGDFTFV